MLDTNKTKEELLLEIETLRKEIEYLKSNELIPKELSSSRVGELRACEYLLEQAGDGFELVDLNGKYIDANKAALESLGYTKEELLNLTIFDIDPTITRDSFKKMTAYFETEKKIITETEHSRKDGTSFPVELVLSQTIINGEYYYIALTRDISERKKVQQQLVESEALLKSIFDKNPECIKIVNKEGQLLQMNSKGLELIEAESLDQVKNESVFDLIYPLDLDYFKKLHQSVINGNPESGEYRIVGLKGTERWMETHATPVILGDERFHLGVTYDITEKKRIQAKLKDSEDLFSDMAEILPVGIYSMDMNLNIVYGNKKALEIFRYTEEDIKKGINCLSLISEADKERAARNIKLRLQGDNVDDPEFTAVRSDGSEFYAYLRIILRVRNGKPVGFLGVAMDISAIKHTETALKESEDSFRSIFEKTSTGYTITNVDGTLSKVNPAFAEMLGYTVEEIHKMNFIELTYPEDQPISLQVVKDMLAGKSRTTVFEKRYVHKNGNIIWTRVSTNLVFDANKNPLHFITNVYNINDIKIAELALKESEEKFSIAFDSVPALLLISDIETGTFIAANKEVLAVSGYSYDEIIGKSSFDLGWMTESSRNEILQKIATYGRVPEFELVLKTKYGEEKTTLFRAELIVINGAKYLLTLAQDITERKSVEQALNESETIQQLIFENSRDAIGVSSNGIHKYINQAYVNIFGYETQDDLLKLNVTDLIANEHRNSVAENIRKRNSNEEVPGYYQTRGLRKDGSEFDMEVRVSSFIIKNQNYSLAILRDITAENRTKELLANAAKEWQSTFDSVNDAIFLLNKDHKILRSNKIASDLFNLDMNQIVGNHCYKIVHKTESPIHGCVVDASIKSNKREMMELQLGQKWFRVTVDPILDAEGKFDMAIHIITDITLNKEAEEKLKLSEESYRNLLENAPFPITVTSVNSNLLFANKATLSYFNLKDSYEDIFGEKLWKHPERRNENIQKIKNDGYITNLENEYIVDNKTVIALVSAAFINYMNQPAILTVFNDITERKKIEQDLINSKQRLIEAQTLAKIGNWELNLITNELYWSDEIFRIFEIDQSKFGARYEDFLNSIHPEDREAVNLAYTESLKNKEPYAIDHRLLLPGGRVKYVYEQCESIYDDAGNPIKSIGTVQDITESRLINEELREKNRELERQHQEYILLNEKLKTTNFDLEIAKSKAEDSDRLKTAFLQNMSHEIRTPLNGILGFSNLLLEEDLPKEDIARFTTVINQSGNRLLELINNVLDISKIETGQINVNKKLFLISSVFSDLNTLFAPVANSKNIFLSYFEENNKNTLFTDEVMFTQVMSNLINNAIKFTSYGQIEFGYNTRGNDYLFFVKDSGVGIPEDKFNIIFERFTQVDLKITRGYEGAGLGLAICKGIVNLLGGKIWVESTVDKGSTFFLTIPKQNNDTIQTDQIVNTAGKFNTENNLVLIVEDDFISYQYLAKLLELFNLKVVYAENGKLAVELVETNPNISLVLMDIRMPVLDGMEATKRIKRIRPSLPVIAQTAYAFNEEKQKILAIGCDDYVSKPITKNILKNLIAKYLNV